MRYGCGHCVTLLALIALSSPCRAAADPDFVLTATAANFESYFPGELANGYISTFTSPRGTESNLAFVAALMGYTADDVSRPAAVPGWSGIDYSTGRSAQGHFWLNHAPLQPTAFRDYRQELDLHAATLDTTYRYDDHGRVTRVAVTSFVSEASPHLAAIRFTITPEFDGTVELSFPLVLWAPYQPRLPLATLDGDTGLTGDRLQQALAAHGLALQPVPPATPDRAALWYPGDVRMLDAEGDTHELTLKLDGRAANGVRVGEAVAVQLPSGLQPVETKLDRSPYRLALDMRVAVAHGKTYVFTKYVALSREGWGGDAAADLALAIAARERGFGALLDRQRAAWAELWRSDIRIDGDPRAQLAVHSDLYYLLANVAAGTAWGTGACGLTTGYFGHVFWDSDSWIFPALVLLHPRRARTLIAFRDRTLRAAQRQARDAGFAGAKYPWEADPENGSEQVMHAARRLGAGEIHVDADIAIAQWQYWLATHDLAWLRDDGWPVIRDLAAFWTSRAVFDATDRHYHIRDVVSVEEPYAHVDDDAFTNASAAKALRIATAAAGLVGAAADPRWAKIAAALSIPFSASAQHHLDFGPNVPHTFGGHGFALLAFPSLDLPMDPTVRRNDYRIEVAPLAKSGDTPGTMGLAPLAIAAAALGDSADVSRWLQADATPAMLKAPFNVRTETPDNNTGYFLTGSAGFVQALVYGVTGLRIEPAGLVRAYPPVLPPGWKAVVLTDVAFRGKRYAITVDRDARGTPRLRVGPAGGADHAATPSP